MRRGYVEEASSAVVQVERIARKLLRRRAPAVAEHEVEIRIAVDVDELDRRRVVVVGRQTARGRVRVPPRAVVQIQEVLTSDAGRPAPPVPDVAEHEIEVPVTVHVAERERARRDAVRW